MKLMGKRITATMLSLLMIMQIFPYNIVYAEEDTTENTNTEDSSPLSLRSGGTSGTIEDVSQTCLTHLKGYNAWMQNIKNTDVIISDPINYKNCNTAPIINLKVITSIDDVKFSLQQGSKKLTLQKLKNLVEGIKDYEDSPDSSISKDNVRIVGWGADKVLTKDEKNYCDTMSKDFNKPCLTEDLLTKLQSSDGNNNITDGTITSGSILDYTILYKYTDSGAGAESGNNKLTSYSKTTVEFNSPPKLTVNAWKTYIGYDLIITDAVKDAYDFEDYESNGITTTNYKERVKISGLNKAKQGRQTVTYKLTDNYGDTTTVQQIVDVMPLPYLTDKGGKRDDLGNASSTVTWNKKHGSYTGQGIGVSGQLEYNTAAVDLTSSSKFNGGVNGATLGTYNTGYTYTSPWKQTVKLPFKVIVDKDPTITSFNTSALYYLKGSVTESKIRDDVLSSMLVDKTYNKFCTSNVNINTKGTYSVTCTAYNQYDSLNTNIKSNTENRIQAMFKNFKTTKVNNQIHIYEQITANANGKAYTTGKKNTFVNPNTNQCATLVNTNGTVTGCTVEGNVRNENSGTHYNSLRIYVTYYANNSNYNQNQSISILVPIITQNHAPSASFKTLIVKNQGINWDDIYYNDNISPYTFNYVNGGQWISNKTTTPTVNDYLNSTYDSDGDYVSTSFSNNFNKPINCGIGSWRVGFNISDNDTGTIEYSNPKKGGVENQYVYINNARPGEMTTLGGNNNGLTNDYYETAFVKRNGDSGWGYTLSGGGRNRCGTNYCFDHTVISAQEDTFGYNGVLPINVKFYNFDKEDSSWYYSGGRFYNQTGFSDNMNGSWNTRFVAGYADGLGYAASRKTIYTYLYYLYISSDTDRNWNYSACGNGYCK